MDFKLTHNSPYNTQLVGPGLVYDVESRSKQTTFRRNGAEIAEIEWHDMRSSLLRMGGQSLKLNDFFPRTSSLSAKRKFTINGSVYTWSPNLKSMKLECDNVKVADFERHALRDSKLCVSQHAVNVLDAIVVTTICMWREEVESAAG
ncbi:hypothetical protein EXIGLDRAFT_697278 [Exidia glandulosa HHB12029]|uniref:DUF6593 domain-containing protein n=1 Tax=Exidia glandulosa HHB12029 TaxID=1314781 RepID=A0A165EUD7_EXIGL|nr:hypothetical protein EXIGLDRAFT_697278 [Exidia glandulosa HHB12029]